jgi:hypothetical protein
MPPPDQQPLLNQHKPKVIQPLSPDLKLNSPVPPVQSETPNVINQPALSPISHPLSEEIGLQNPESSATVSRPVYSQPALSGNLASSLGNEEPAVTNTTTSQHVLSLANTTDLAEMTAQTPPGTASDLSAGIVVSPPSGNQSNFSNPPGQTPPVLQKRKRFTKRLVIPIVSAFILLLGGGGAYAYFGVYMSPSFVWNQSLSNMNLGTTMLVNYLNQSQAVHNSGVNLNGHFNLSLPGKNITGNLDASYGDNQDSTVSANIDLGVANLNLEERGITTPGNNTPDIYFKLSGLKTLNNNILGGTLSPKITAFDGKWIEIDHNFISDIENSIQQSGSANNLTLTKSDVISFLRALNLTNQQYLFTTNKQTAVFRVVKNYNRQKVDGIDTYSYKLGINDAHFASYIGALCNNLNRSGLGKYLKTGLSASAAITNACKTLENNASHISASDYLTAWVNLSTRTLYKLRIPIYKSGYNPLTNYIDIGFNYNGGNNYDFFINPVGNDKTGSAAAYINATLNSRTNQVNLTARANFKGNQPNSNYSFNGNLSFAPITQTLKVTPPTGAIPLTSILNGLMSLQYLNPNTVQKSPAIPQLTGTQIQQMPASILTALKL